MGSVHLFRPARYPMTARLPQGTVSPTARRPRRRRWNTRPSWFHARLGTEGLLHGRSGDSSPSRAGRVLHPGHTGRVLHPGHTGSGAGGAPARATAMCRRERRRRRAARRATTSHRQSERRTQARKQTPDGEGRRGVRKTNKQTNKQTNNQPGATNEAERPRPRPCSARRRIRMRRGCEQYFESRY
jgi:hypothetical protein